MNGWISVEDKYPFKHDWLVLLAGNGHVTAGYISKEKCEDVYGNTLYGITHWMERPPAPVITTDKESDKYMATVYKFEVECVSAFCAYKPEYMRKQLEEFLKNWRDPDMKDHPNKLESITVKIKEVK